MVLLGLTVSLQRMREACYPAAATGDESLYIRSGTALRRMTVAYQALAADLYWIRAIQYYGGTKRALAAGARAGAGASPDALAQSRYGLLYPLLDVTTSLDPRFNIAYRFGAIFLAEPYPGGPGRPDLAIALLQKGLRERSDKWEYMQDIGFVYYWWMHDYRAAAQWFDQGAAVPGAPWWLEPLAATTLAQGGDRRSSRLMWESMRQLAENEWLRSNAEHRLQQLTALDQIDAMQAIADTYLARSGAPPSSWTALVRAGMLPGTPVDPTGAPYTIDQYGRVRLGETSTLYPLPDEPITLGGKPVS